MFFSHTGEVWVGVAFGLMVWSVMIYVLQRTWNIFRENQNVSFLTGLIYGWGALLEQPPADPSVTISGQVLTLGSFN